MPPDMRTREIGERRNTMMHEYIEFTEQYKGFTLETVKYRFSESRSGYHKDVRVSKGGNGVAICKTKKEAKELIDLGCFEAINNAWRDN